MGCVAVSSSSFNEYCKTAEFKEWKGRLQALQIEKSAMRKLYNMFMRIDTERKERVHHLDLSKNFALEKTKFTERIWCMLSDDGLGELTFVQFLLTSYNLCTLSKGELGKLCSSAQSPSSLKCFILFLATVSFVFDLYDCEGVGVLPSATISNMLKDFYACKITHALIATM